MIRDLLLFCSGIDFAVACYYVAVGAGWPAVGFTALAICCWVRAKS